MEDGILISCEIGGASSKLTIGVLVVDLIDDIIDDLICRYCRNCLSVMPNFWTKSSNVEKLPLTKICCK